MVMFLVITAVWSLAAFLLGRPLSSSLVGTLILAEGLILAQGLTGVLLWLLGQRATEGVHFLYGLAAALSLPAVLVYARDRPDRTRLLLYGLTSIWIVGLSIRGITTGG